MTFCLLLFCSLKSLAEDEQARFIVSYPKEKENIILFKPVLELLKSNNIDYKFNPEVIYENKERFIDEKLGVYDNSLKLADEIYTVGTILLTDDENSDNIYTTYAIDYKNKKYKPLEIQISDEIVYPSEKMPNYISWLDISENSVEKALLNDLGSINGWFYLGKDEKNNEYFIDKNEIKYGENNKTAKINLKKIIANPNNQYSAKYSLIAKKLDCTTSLWMDDSVISLTKDFSVINNSRSVLASEFLKNTYPQNALEKNIFYGVCQPNNNDFTSKQGRIYNPVNLSDKKFVEKYDYDLITSLYDIAESYVDSIYRNFTGGYGNYSSPKKTFSKIQSEIGSFEVIIAININKDGVVKDVKIVKGFKNPAYDIYVKQAATNLNLLKYGSDARPTFEIENVNDFWVVTRFKS